MLALKLFLVPSFLAIISLAGRRWGPGVAGWLAGFPVVTGPILLLLGLERGPDFAASAAQASLSGATAIVSFTVTYAWVCTRMGWAPSLIAGLGAWFTAALLLAQLPPTLFVSLPVALLTLFVAPSLFPKVAERSGDLPHPANALPHQELLLRVIAGAVLTLLVTGVAASVGPGWSGLLGVFPLMATILAAFSQRASGAPFAVVLLRGMLSGLYAFVAFTFAAAWLLPIYGVGPSFAVALALALITHALARTLPSFYLRRA